MKIQQSQPHPQPTQPPTQAPLTDQAQLPHLNPNECDTNQNNSINGNANNFNRNDNRLNTVPPPLMSQNISMPRTGINPNYISSQQQQRINFPAENNFQVCIPDGEEKKQKKKTKKQNRKIYFLGKFFNFRIRNLHKLQCKTVYSQ